MKLRFVIFFSIVLLVVLSVHFYFWVRLVRDTGVPYPWRRLLGAGVGALAFSLIGGMLVQRVLPLATARLVLFPVYVWMGLMFFLLVLLGSGDLFQLGARLTNYLSRGADLDPQRRLFLSRLVGGTVAFGAFGLTALSSRAALALSNVSVKRVEVGLSRLPRQFDGFRIVQLSDIHIGPTLGRAWLEGIVERVNALEPDLIAITGDLVDGSVEALRQEIAPLSRLKAKHGTFVCTGNHEYYSGAVAWCDEFERLGLRVLRNERVPIGKDTEVAFDLAGVDDFNARGMAPGHGPDLSAALEGRESDRELVLLAHQPRAIFEAAEKGVGLQLSGHTHGGQIWPMHFFVRLQQPYLSGLVEHEQTQLYVSEGTGFWGPPMRLGTTAEISELILSRASA
jgi:predicted MPP superfamily phosphohydrolase